MKRPWLSTGKAFIYHGDAREEIPKLAESGVTPDLIITDIPYDTANDEKRSKGRQKYKGQLRSQDKGHEDEPTFPVEDVVPLLLTLGAKSHYVFCSTEQAGIIRGAFDEAGLSTRTGIWIKSNPSPQNGQHLWPNAVEVFIFARRPKAYFAKKYHCKPLVFRGPSVHHTKRRLKTEKPTWLTDTLVEASCPPGGLVLDPFMGAGPVMESARRFGMRAVGIDRVLKCCKFTRNRLLGA